MKSFVSYYKWHIIITVIVAACALFIYRGVATKKEPDLSMVFVSRTYMNTQYFEDYKSEIELLLKDVNHDSKRYAAIKAFSLKRDSDAAAKLEECISSGMYDAYIADKQAFEAIKDKSVFENAASYIPADEERDHLEDEDGRLYAVSLKDNSLAKRLGIIENENLYIAVGVNMKDGERSDSMKNAMNISGYIIKNKNKYNF